MSTLPWELCPGEVSGKLVIGTVAGEERRLRWICEIPKGLLLRRVCPKCVPPAVLSNVLRMLHALCVKGSPG